MWEKCQVTYKGKLSEITLDLSAETLNANKARNDLFQAPSVNIF
jgi:hypothetical protein